MTNIKKLAIALLLFSSLSPMTQAWANDYNLAVPPGEKAVEPIGPKPAVDEVRVMPLKGGAP